MNEKPYKFQIGSETVEADKDSLGVCLFRDQRDVEYADYHTFNEETGEETHHFIFNQRDWLIWIGGVCLDAEDRRTLQLANRSHGSFERNYGWRPPVRVDDEPTEWEVDAWVLVMGNVDLHADLEQSLKEDLDE